MTRTLAGCFMGCVGVGALLLASGCTLLYRNTITPYTINFNNTKVGSTRCVMHSYKLKDPVSGYNVSAEWDADTVVRAARRAGITNIFYADEQIFRVLSVYQCKTLIIYGD